MPLPLPSLDNRRWTDLVEEGRSLLPRYATAWTNHNVSDPGITLLELFAAKTEAEIFRLNRVPERHRRKMLGLIGYSPRPPRPTIVPLTFTGNGGSAQSIPAGLVLTTGGGATPPISYRVMRRLTIAPCSLVTVQVFDGARLTDQTRAWSEGRPILAFGPNPGLPSRPDAELQPALYLGFDTALPVGAPVGLWLSFQGPRTDLAERLRLASEAAEQADECRPVNAGWPCPSCGHPDSQPLASVAPEADAPDPATDRGPVSPSLEPPPEHHSARTLWESYDGAAWREVGSGGGVVQDETRALTLDGPVQLTLGEVMQPLALGSVAPRYYLRVRLAAGQLDSAPVVRSLRFNAVAAEQLTRSLETYEIAPAPPPGADSAPVPLAHNRLTFDLDGEGRMVGLQRVADADAPETFVWSYTPPTEHEPGAIALDLALLGHGSGLPGLSLTLPDAPVGFGRLELWSLEEGRARSWRQRPDFDASGRADADFSLATSAGRVSVGDGERGRVVPAGAPMLARFDATAGARGRVPAGAAWHIAADRRNASLLGGEEQEAALGAALGTISGLAPWDGGADEETLDEAAGRAAEVLWAHERLLELLPPGGDGTLDQLDPAVVMSHRAPDRAVTIADFERLALDVPGTRLSRARAWASLDVAEPSFKAPGTVTVVVVPELPAGRPRPSDGLLRAVRRFLHRRRTVGTRLVVAGPEYLEVNVTATVQARPNASLDRVRQDIVATLRAFLDPISGGPLGRGWPFGRNVYRSEILQLVDDVAGADHVLSLSLAANGCPAQCGNLALPPTWLAAPGTMSIEVVR